MIKFNKIKKSDITIIVQGRIIPKVTINTLLSIRKYFKNSKIILSTWTGSDVTYLDFDELILSQEPTKATFNLDKKEINHTNYQLISTQKALEKVKTKYCLKLRTDSIIKSDSILKYWNEYKIRNSIYSIFYHKIIIPSIYSREEFDETLTPMPFHPSDIFLFGLTEDLKDYFMKTLPMTEAELGNWITKYPNKKPIFSLTYRYCAEQYYCFSWVKRHFHNIKFEDWSDWNQENIELSKKILTNNFIILDLKQHNINSQTLRHLNSNLNSRKIKGLLTNKLYKKNYKKYSTITNDISVVVQGLVEPIVTSRCLKSIRKFLPNAEIILSTWQDTDLSSLNGLYDKLVLNKSPEAIVFDDKTQKINNLNRILLSSKTGIDAATKKYVLRIRSDLILKNDNLLKLFDNFPVRNQKSVLFKQKIFAYEKFSLKYNKKKNIKQRMLFHISDWCYFGLKEDLQELFNIPLVQEPDFSRYFDYHKKNTDDIHSSRTWRMSPEQYITSTNTKKVFKNINFDNYLDVTDENIKYSEDFIINNFRVFSASKWGITTQKNLYKNIHMKVYCPFDYYSELEQLIDYQKYCDKSFNCKKQIFLNKLWQIKYYPQLRKHFFSIYYTKPSKKLSEILSTIIYFTLFIFTLPKEIYSKKLF